jgi:hypothetical protein
MLRIPAHTARGFAGWLRIPEKQNFSWTLRIEARPTSFVMVPVRAQTQDRGWTHYHYADLSTLTSAQLKALAETNWFEPEAAVNAA